MEIGVLGALRRGFDRSVTRNGLWLMAAFLALDILFVAVPATVFNPQDAVSNAFALGITSIIGFILSMVVTVIAIRAFVDYDSTTQLQEYAHDGIGFASLNLVIGLVVVLSIIGIGFILIIPGIYLLVSLLFWHIIVSEEGEDFVDALRESWRITRGHKWRLFLLVVGVVLVIVTANAIGVLLSLVIPGILLSSIVAGALNVFSMVFGLAAVVDAYVQIVR